MSKMDDPTPTNIKDARQKKASKERRDKPKPADLYHAIMDAINATQWSQLPDFPHKLRLIEPERGTKIALIEEADEVVTEVPDAHIINLVMQYTQRELGRMQDYRFTVRDAAACVDYWKASTVATIDPAMVLWADEPGYCYRRLPWTRSQDGQTPLWDELIERMGPQGSAFMAWIGSLFFPDSDRQQYLWLYGNGQNGKGAITRFLGRVFGRSFRSQQPPNQGDRFWTLALLGARLVSFPDCNAAAFPASGLFKSMTGDDAIRMEIKGGAVFNAHISAKFMFSSNEKPTLSSELADLRRAIFVNLAAIPGPPDPGYERGLWDEGGRFLSNCIGYFECNYPHHGRIDVSDSELKAHVSTLEEEFEVLTAQEFTVLPIPDKAILRDIPGVTPVKMQEVLKRAFKDKKSHCAYLKYLEINHGIKRTQVKMQNGDRVWRYPGLESK